MHGQAGGTIAGTVRDVTEGVIGSPKIVIVNSDTNVSREIQVNSLGVYSVPNLRSGTDSASTL